MMDFSNGYQDSLARLRWIAAILFAIIALLGTHANLANR